MESCAPHFAIRGFKFANREVRISMAYAESVKRDPLAELAGVSKLAYGNMHTLLTILTIIDCVDGLIFQSNLTRELTKIIESTTTNVRPLSGSTVSDTLTKLSNLGMLQKLPDDGNRKPYQRVDTSAGWAWARELAGSNWPLRLMDVPR